jgi:hypothetical protein
MYQFIIFHDQSRSNIHFYQSLLGLSLLWNWQNSDSVNLVGEFVSPYLIHSFEAAKIWNADNGYLPGRYYATLSPTWVSPFRIRNFPVVF